MTSPPKVLLVGMMGAGKSTVGAALSTRLGWPYLDNDVLLLRTTGRTAPELLAEQGSQALRSAESTVLTLLLGMPGPLIGAVPGGCVLDDTDRGRLHAAGCTVAWLRCSPAVLARRVGNGAGRARLGGDPAAGLAMLAAERDPLYAEVATCRLDVDLVPAGVVARQLAELVLDLPSN